MVVTVSPRGDFAQAAQLVRSFERDFSRSSNASNSKIPNPLRNHNHYNYIITLGILSAQNVNDPSTYRNGGFQKIIVRSGGGQYDIRQRLFLEQGENAEYFIDNLEVDALIAPNEKTGIALGTTVKFEIVEPYSMGKFIEALIAAAASVGHSSFNNAPYCLKVEFVGWDEFGLNKVDYVAKPYFLPIMITNVEFNVKESGSVYNVQAVPYSEIALSSHVDQIHTEVKATGRFVHEVLENGELSVTNIINNNISNIEENTTVTNYDRFIVLFPRTSTTIMEALSSGAITGEGLRNITDQSLTRLRGIDTSNFYAENPELRLFFRDSISVRVNSDIYQILKSLAVDTSQMNNLGNSALAIDPLTGGTQTPTPPLGMYESTLYGIARRSAAAAQPSQRSREYTFSQGTRITEIIETVLLDSQVIRDQAVNRSDGESPRLYRIETYTFIVDRPDIEKIIGRAPKVYVYAVHPYVSDQAHYLAPNQTPQTTQQLIEKSVKEYNYFYTGKNEDILNFDINFNYGFMQAAYSDYGQLTAVERVRTQSSIVAGDQTLNISPPTTGANTTIANPSLERFPEYDRVLLGSQLTDASSQLARMIHNIFINSNVDLINAEMKIWGDPYYLPTITGNYSPASMNDMLTQDESINYLRNDVTVVVNFVNPLDYEISNPTMTFNNEINPAFSGVYQVISVTSQFQKGQFVQDIKLLRQRGQENNGVTAERVLVINGEGTGLNSQQPLASNVPLAAGTPYTTNNAATQVDPGTVVDQRTGIWGNALDLSGRPIIGQQ